MFRVGQRSGHSPFVSVGRASDGRSDDTGLTTLRTVRPVLHGCARRIGAFLAFEKSPESWRNGDNGHLDGRYLDATKGGLALSPITHPN